MTGAAHRVAALLVLAVAATLAIGAPALGDPASDGSPQGVASALRAEYPLHDAKSCCSAPQSAGAAAVETPLRSPDGGGDGGIPVGPLLIAISAFAAVALIARSRPEAFPRIDPTRLGASAGAIPAAVRRVDLSRLLVRRDRTRDVEIAPRGRDWPNRETGPRAPRPGRDRARAAEVPVGAAESGGMIGHGDRVKAKRKTWRRRGRPTREQGVPEEAVPEEALPEEAPPEGAVPESAVPEEALPEEVLPEEAMPEEAVREEAPLEEALPEGPLRAAPPLREALPEAGVPPPRERSSGAPAPVHLVTPHSFGEVQELATGFRHSVPVILDLRAAEPELAGRLIDFASGFTFGLGGAMQALADHVFLLIPRRVVVSPDERARLLEVLNRS